MIQEWESFFGRYRFDLYRHEQFPAKIASDWRDIASQRLSSKPLHLSPSLSFHHSKAILRSTLSSAAMHINCLAVAAVLRGCTSVLAQWRTSGHDRLQEFRDDARNAEAIRSHTYCSSIRLGRNRLQMPTPLRSSHFSA